MGSWAHNGTSQRSDSQDNDPPGGDDHTAQATAWASSAAVAVEEVGSIPVQVGGTGSTPSKGTASPQRRHIDWLLSPAAEAEGAVGEVGQVDGSDDSHDGGDYHRYRYCSLRYPYVNLAKKKGKNLNVWE